MSGWKEWKIASVEEVKEMKGQDVGTITPDVYLENAEIQE